MRHKNLEQPSVKERLIDFVRYLDVPISAFEKSVGLSNGFINNIRRDIGHDKLEQISNRYPELNPVWLKMGVGKMIDNHELKTTKDQETTIIKKKSMSEIKQNGSRPVFNIYGLAGKTDFVNTMDNIEILGYIKVPGYENCLGWVKVKGDSMTPFLNSGDFVAIRLIDRRLIAWGNVYFIVFAGDNAPEPMIKYVRKGNHKDTFILRSHNEKYEDMEIPNESIKDFYAVRGGVIEIQ